MRCHDTCCRPDTGDWPDIQVLGRRAVKSTRKEHVCWYCGQVMAVGSAANTETFLSEGRVETIYKHSPPCGGGEGAV